MTVEGGTPRALTAAELDDLEDRVDAWAARQLADNDAVVAVDRGEPGQRRWYVRLRGEERETLAVWFTVQQRTLAYETYVMPAPEEGHAELYEYLLRRNRSLYGASFAIGAEDAVYIVGQFPAGAVTDDELDRILGSLYAWTERHFRAALRIGFASRLVG
ncbi:MAG: YbjN domain-containing protein [Acidimicrobiales bacterium]